MDMKLVDSEIKVMDVLWKEGDSMAKHVADVMKERYGWNVNTTYTLLKRCIKKGAVERTDPNFVCHALIKQEQVQAQETDELLHKVFDGSVDKLFASLLGRRNLTAEQVEKLKEMVEELGGMEHESDSNEYFCCSDDLCYNRHSGDFHQPSA